MTTSHLPAVEETLFASLLDERVGGLAFKFSALCFVLLSSYVALITSLRVKAFGNASRAIAFMY